MKKNKRTIRIVTIILVIAITSIVSVSAERMIASSIVSYNNGTSGLNSTNVQGAVDELYTKQNSITNNLKQKYYELISKHPENVPLVDYIRGTLKDDGATILQDDGTKGHNMRYIGSNPNNWLSFNGELWRIIGVFGTDSHGQNEELIKIQSTKSLGKIKWDENSINDWSKATLRTYLNEGEYYTTVLNANAKQMIQTVDWKLGTTPWEEARMYANIFYNNERGNVGVKSNPALTEWNEKVALAYISDYNFATNGGSTHNRTECIAAQAKNTDSEDALWRTDAANIGECATGSWMIQEVRNTKTYPWTLTTQSNGGMVFTVYYNSTSGFVGGFSPSNINGDVIPAVYLKSNVICTNCGNSNVGAESNPYQIELK